jgi:hypothetical protein
MLELIGLQEDLVTRVCACALEQRQGNDLSATAVVFPSRRFGFFLRQRLAEAMPGNFFPPALFSIAAFFESLFKLNFPGWRILGEMEAAGALHDSVKTVFASGLYGSRQVGSFPVFLPWARRLLQALEEIESEGSDIQAIPWESYREFTRLGEYHRHYKEFIQGIPGLLEHLRQSLQARQQVTEAMSWRRVADLAENGELRCPAAGHWIFCAFNAMNACEKKLFRFFAGRHGARLILRTDPRGLRDPLSPFRLQGETIAGLGLPLPAALPDSRAWDDLGSRVTIQPCDGVESEVYQAFRRLEEVCRGRSETDLRKVAVLLPSAPSLIPFVQGAISRFDQGRMEIPFNITLGYPLERTPLMQLVDSLLTVLEKAIADSIAAEDYLRLVRHPYVKISGAGDDREPLKRGVHLLENIIHEANLVRFSIAELEDRLGVELERAETGGAAELRAAIIGQVRRLHGLFIPRRITDMPSLLAFMRRVLDSVGSQPNRDAQLFLNEYVAAALDALQELEEFAGSHGHAFLGADPTALAALVRSHFRGRTIRFEGSPLKGVQVMGPLEFRGLCFDEVIVLDALEGVLPGTAKYDPILPADIRAIFGVRDHGDWEKVYAFNFFAMLGAAGRAHILYPRKSEDGQECERSRFIERIVYAVEKNRIPAPAAELQPLPFAIVSRELKKVKKSPAIRARLGAFPLSPSALEMYCRCPLQFYFSRILGLEEQKELAIETEGGLIGTIAHKTLQGFYEKYAAAGALAGADEESLQEDLKLFLHRAFREQRFDPEKGLERIRSWALLEQLRLFVSQDRLRIMENGIRIARQEKTLQADFAVPGLEQAIPIKGRLDRLEREQGLWRVVDYKTGEAFSPRFRLDAALDLSDLARRDEKNYLDALASFHARYPALQVLVYLLLLAREQDLRGDEMDAAYVFLREKGGKMVQGVFRSMGRNPRPFSADEKNLALSIFTVDLNEVLSDLFRREYFLANPGDERACGWCPFRLPCGNL